MRFSTIVPTISTARLWRSSSTTTPSLAGALALRDKPLGAADLREIDREPVRRHAGSVMPPEASICLRELPRERSPPPPPPESPSGGVDEGGGSQRSSTAREGLSG